MFSSGENVVALVPLTTPQLYAQTTASVYHWPSGTSVNGAVMPATLGDPLIR